MRFLILFGMLSMAGPASAQDFDLAQNLKRLSIEELLDLDITSVSRKSESLSRTAAAVQVLTSDDIRRSGATTIPELLRLFVGVQVSRFNAGSWAIGVRGLTTNVSNKLLVMIDGRSVYSPLFSGTFWEVQDTVLEDIARIEIVRGPGGTLWEANAMNGIINIITKKATNTQGAFVRAGGGGTDDLAFGTVRWGDRIGTRTSYRIFAKYTYRDQMKLPSGAEARDQLRTGRSGFRIDSDLSTRDLLTIQGDIYEAKAGIRTRPDAVVSGGNVLARWTRIFSDRSDFQIQAYFDRTNRFVPSQSGEHRATFDVDLQHRFLWSGNDFIWGLGYRSSSDRTDDLPNLSTRFTPARRRLSWTNAFVQDQIELWPERVHLTIGSKFEYDSYSGFEAQPSARVAVLLNPQHTLWSGISRAVRTPSRFDQEIRVAAGPFLFRGSEEFESESLIAYEVGYRTELRPNLSLDISTFYNVYDDLRSLEPQTPTTYVTQNDLNARTYGGEVMVTYDPMENLRLLGSYSRLRKTFSSDPGKVTAPFGANFESNDAGHMFTLRSELDLPHNIEFDATARFVGAAVTGDAASPAVPRYLGMDGRLGWFLVPEVEVFVVGRNLTDPRHQEYPAGHQILRNIYGGVNFRF